MLAPGTAPYPYVFRAAELFNCRTAPCVMTTTWDAGHDHGIPEQDLLAATAADEIFVLYLRRGGSIHRLTRLLLEQTPGSRPLVNLALLEQTPRDLIEDLLALGAVAWLPQMSEAKKTKGRLLEESGRGAGEQSANEPRRSFLLHCTRAQDGPWPGERRTRHIDDLLLGFSRANHSALAALVRIVASRRLMASSRGIRGGYSVVSFANVPVQSLPDMRTYRSHRGRWDFEPFGIGISETWLASQQGRPVEYGDESTWKSLGPDQRAYFQMVRSSKSGREIDWSQEREWRHVGDVDLSAVSIDDAFVFVPDESAAARVSRICQWPVVVLNAGSQ